MIAADVSRLVLENSTLTDGQRRRVLRLWADVLVWAKPDREGMPISPVELGYMRGELEAQLLVTRTLLTALAEARARRPAHFRLVIVEDNT